MTTTYRGTVRDGKIELDQPLTLPEGSQVRVMLLTDLDEPTARRRADRWLEENVGDAVAAKNGRFIQRDDRHMWRFEAFVTGPYIDPLGPIGQVDIDADSGDILTPFDIAEDMIARGAALPPHP